MPLLTLFALKAMLDLEALNSNNVRGGTCDADAGSATKSGLAGAQPISIIVNSPAALTNVSAVAG